MLIALFVVYQGATNYKVTISGSMINPDAEIVFMPLHRSIKQPEKKSSEVTKQISQKSVASSTKVNEEGGTTIVKIVQAKPKAKATKEAKKAVAKKNEKVTGPEKEIAAKKNVKLESKSSSQVEKPEPKIEEKKAVEATSEKTIDIKENNISSNSSVATMEATDTRANDTNIVYVGQEEMDSLQAQEYVQQELAQHWAPPAGMRSDLQAIITLTIDFEGAIKHIELTHASGNLLFDTAAKKAAAQITPARWAYGKKFAITFKP